MANVSMIIASLAGLEVLLQAEYSSLLEFPTRLGLERRPHYHIGRCWIRANCVLGTRRRVSGPSPLSGEFETFVLHFLEIP